MGSENSPDMARSIQAPIFFNSSNSRLGAIPAVTRQDEGHTLERLPIYYRSNNTERENHHAHIQTYGQFKW